MATGPNWVQSCCCQGEGLNMYSDDDTDWALSARGNYWKRLNGKVLVVGEKNNGEYWAMYDGDFVKGSFSTELKAKSALEEGLDDKFEQPLGDGK